jgi:hypothetical protein
MAVQNLQQYGCQTGNKLKEKSRDLNWNSSIHTSTINAPKKGAYHDDCCVL